MTKSKIALFAKTMNGALDRLLDNNVITPELRKRFRDFQDELEFGKQFFDLVEVNNLIDELKIIESVKIVDCILPGTGEQVEALFALTELGKTRKDLLEIDDPLCKTARSLGREGVSRGGARRLAKKMRLSPTVTEEFIECFGIGEGEL
jgi:hypothetical protein